MKKLFATLMMCGLMANSAMCDLTYSFRFDPVSSTVATGIASSVDLYLDETSTNLMTFPLKISEGAIGLATGNAAVTLNTVPGSFNSATPTFVNDGILTTALGTAVGTNASLAQTSFEPILLPFSIGSASGLVASIKLGSFSFTTTAAGNGTISTDLVSVGELVLGDIVITDLATAGVAPGIFNFESISAVPEPASLGGALILLGTWFGLRRSRKMRVVNAMKDFE